MVSAMRSIACECQPQISRQIAVSGASNGKWKRDLGEVTFYFTSASNRREFICEVSRILRTGWEETGRGDKKAAPHRN